MPKEIIEQAWKPSAIQKYQENIGSEPYQKLSDLINKLWTLNFTTSQEAIS